MFDYFGLCNILSSVSTDTEMLGKPLPVKLACKNYCSKGKHNLGNLSSFSNEVKKGCLLEFELLARLVKKNLSRRGLRLEKVHIIIENSKMRVSM